MDQRETLATFLDAVQIRDWDAAIKRCTRTAQSKTGSNMVWWRFDHLVFDAFDIVRLVKVNSVVEDWRVTLEVDGMTLKVGTMRLVREEAPYRTGEQGTWGVNPESWR